MDKNYRITIIADEALAEAIKAYAEENPADMEIESERSNRDAARLGFDIGGAADIVTLVTATFFFGELAVRLFQWMRANRSNKIIIQTPMKTVEISNSAQLTEKEVLRLLKSAYESPD